VTEKFNGGTGCAVCNGCHAIVRYGTEARPTPHKPHVVVSATDPAPWDGGAPGVYYLHFCDPGDKGLACMQKALTERGIPEHEKVAIDGAMAAMPGEATPLVHPAEVELLEEPGVMAERLRAAEPDWYDVHSVRNEQPARLFVHAAREGIRERDRKTAEALRKVLAIGEEGTSGASQRAWLALSAVVEQLAPRGSHRLADVARVCRKADELIATLTPGGTLTEEQGRTFLGLADAASREPFAFVPAPAPGRTIFGCRCCDTSIGGTNDGGFDAPGWGRIQNIDGPDAICPRCKADPTSLDAIKADGYENARVKAMTVGEFREALSHYPEGLEVVLRLSDSEGLTYLAGVSTLEVEQGCAETAALIIDGDIEEASQLPAESLEGHAPVHEHFGLSYASYLVLPRVVLQSMPTEWQGRLVGLLGEYEAAIERSGLSVRDTYRVTPTDARGKFVSLGLPHYRHAQNLMESTKATSEPTAAPLISCRPGVHGGAPCIAGTRITVSTLVACRDGGWGDAKILEQYPTLTAEQLAAAWTWNDAHPIPPEQE
jgi:uncharacterized protein (DUF433 family)